MTAAVPITIAIPTYHRPDGLRRAVCSARDRLNESPLGAEVTEILVVDNASDGSGRSTVETIEWPLLRYVHEPTPGVATARNRALDEATGDVLVFFDDDERAGPGWPDGLVETMRRYDAALVAGPVHTEFGSPVPDWVVSLGVFERPEHPDGAVLPWTRSGNLAIDMSQIRAAGLRFDPAFDTGGEDVRFSTLAHRAGLESRWSSDAVVFEDVGEDRMSAGWITRRSQTAMANYVRAQRPLTPTTAARIGLVASARIAGGAAELALGWIARSEEWHMRGAIRMRRGLGAWSALRSRPWTGSPE